MEKKKRALLQTLILSAALNIVFVGIFFYFIIQDNPLHFSYAPKGESKCKNIPCPLPFLSQLCNLKMEELFEYLEDGREVKDGYKVRDFALSALFAIYDFDAPRALNQKQIQKRVWAAGSHSFTLYPNLKDEDFKQIRQFAKKERWPLTAKGLFRQIANKTIEESDPELIAQFCHTEEFILLQTLFARQKLPLQKRTLLKLVLEGKWEDLETFCAKQEKELNLSNDSCRELLLTYLDRGSRSAAYLLILTEEAFILNQFEDEKMKKFISLLHVKTKEACRFLHKLSSQERGKEVIEMAHMKLHLFGEKEVAARYFNRPAEGNLRPVFREKHPPSIEPKTHVVAEGESLWLISRKYHVPIDKLMQINGLQSTSLRPGRLLKIP